MGAYDIRAFAQPKSLDRSTGNFIQLTTSVRPPNVPKIVKIGLLVAAAQMGEVNGPVAVPFIPSFTLPYFTLPFSCVVPQTRPLD
jgi:hypothetical protein